MAATKHFFTIAQNGTILEASDNAVGYPTQRLLMTSVLDTIYDDDVSVFLCIKTEYWDKQLLNSEVYIRRKSFDGTYVWLLSKAIAFVIELGIFAIVLEETIVDDCDVAISVNRIAKFATTLVQAIDSSWNLGNETTESSTCNSKSIVENLDSITVSDGSEQQMSFDPEEVVNSLRNGSRLDLGKFILNPEDAKLITLMLLGRVTREQVIQLLNNSLRLGFGLKSLLNEYTLSLERESYLERTCRLHSFYAPPLSVINLSFSNIGNIGVEYISDIFLDKHTNIKILDLSFSNIGERGILALSNALMRRQEMGMKCLKGLLLSGNYISSASALALGTALSPKFTHNPPSSATLRTHVDDNSNEHMEGGHIQLLHVANTSMTSHTASLLIRSLGSNCSLRELNMASNNFGKVGSEHLAETLELETKTLNGSSKPATTLYLPLLENFDLSDNDLANEGTTRLSKAIRKRNISKLVHLKLSSNFIGLTGIETVINNLLHYNLKSLSLDKNCIGDNGCQLVAASLLSMKTLCRLNLGFNQIGSRGITSLMRSLISCESMTYLGLSGNILKISGAIAVAFVLAQHPRLEELDVESCCLDEASQCHLVAGIISNRLAPMKRLKGFSLGPPLVVVNALDPQFANSSNAECLKIRLNEQMKTILQWMEANRSAKIEGEHVNHGMYDEAVTEFKNARFLSPELVVHLNEVHGAPSQNPYFRLLGWLSRIPFYEEELASLQKFFYDLDGGEGDRGSGGQINLKLRGDILAGLDDEIAEEFKDEVYGEDLIHESIGMDLDSLFGANETLSFDRPFRNSDSFDHTLLNMNQQNGSSSNAFCPTEENGIESFRTDAAVQSDHSALLHPKKSLLLAEKESRYTKLKPRITMFPFFEQQLSELKSITTDMIEKEDDPHQHEIILTQYAEAVLVILRQLRYLCMNCGLDGWRRSSVKRKILIVDDTLSTRKVVARAFENANFIVDTASNGVEGVKMLKVSLYDIVFMDIEMPIMDGLEATKELRRWEDINRPHARQPICALTGQDTNQRKLLEIREAGIDVMEKKPCHLPRLFKVVDDVSPMLSDINMSLI